MRTFKYLYLFTIAVLLNSYHAFADDMHYQYQLLNNAIEANRSSSNKSEDNGFYIQRFDVDAHMTENYAMHVKKSTVMEFTQEKHGLYRYWYMVGYKERDARKEGSTSPWMKNTHRNKTISKSCIIQMNFYKEH